MNDRETRDRLFLTSLAALTVLTGLSVPAMVIASSAQEFSFIGGHDSPVYFIGAAFRASLGLFLVWLPVLYFLFGKKAKTVFASLAFVFLLIAVVDVFAFPGAYGDISNTFRFDNPGLLAASPLTVAANGAAILACVVFFAALLKTGRPRIALTLSGIILCALAAFTVPKFIQIHRDFSTLAAIKNADGGATRALTPIFSLSKTGPNLVIIMADRAINGFARPILEESEELRAAFDGFTLYPNTVSFNDHTLLAVPALWGGYE